MIDINRNSQMYQPWIKFFDPTISILSKQMDEENGAGNKKIPWTLELKKIRQIWWKIGRQLQQKTQF